LRRFTSGQTELDPLAEEPAGSDAMRRQTAVSRDAKPFLLLRHPRFCSSVNRRRFDRRPFLAVSYSARN
jgi:hypothetical protein